MLRLLAATTLSALLITGCASVRETNPTQTAREQLLMSGAADQASLKIKPNIPIGNKMFIDVTDINDDPEYNKQYAVNAVRAQLLRDGYQIVGKEKEADTIASLSTGAMSIDEHDSLVGIPSFTLPIPLAGPLTTPEIAFYKKKKRTGVAKLMVSFYDAKTGGLRDVVGPVFGFAHFDKSSLLFFHSTSNTLMSPADEAEMNEKKPAAPGT